MCLAARPGGVRCRQAPDRAEPRRSHSPGHQSPVSQRRAVASVGYGGVVYIWDVRRELPINAYRMPSGDRSVDGKLLSLAIDRKNGLLAVGGSGYLINGRKVSPIFLIDWVKGTFVGTLEGHDELIFSLAFSPDGRLLASGGDSTTRVWDVVKRKPTGLEISHKKNLHERPWPSAAPTRMLSGLWGWDGGLAMAHDR